MNKEQILEFAPTDPLIVLCKDGLFGMMTIYPVYKDVCGIQVPGEEELRWIPPEEMSLVGDECALIQKGASVDSALEYPGNSEQMLLKLVWLGCSR